MVVLVGMADVTYSRQRPKMTDIECACGAPVVKRDLDEGMAFLYGVRSIWVHENGRLYCYDNDDECVATPGDGEG